MWPGARSCSFGSSWEQRGIANGQRGKPQPDGELMGEGTSQAAKQIRYGLWKIGEVSHL